MENKKNYFLTYIRQHGRITNGDMTGIKQETGVKISEQISILKKLEKEKEIKNYTNNAWEPDFRLNEDTSHDIEKVLDDDENRKSIDIKGKIFQHIHHNKGVFSDIDFFLDHGVPLDAQKRYLDLLVKEGDIIRTQGGYMINKSRNRSLI